MANTRKDIKEIAQDIAFFFETFDVDTLIDYLGIKLSFVDLSELGLNTLALSVGYTVQLDNRLHGELLEIAKAHELGHIILGHNEKEVCYFNGSNSPIEREANYFMAVMLASKYETDIETMMLRLTDKYNIQF